MNMTNTAKHEDLKADVVVIGSGGGLAAAVAAAEAGASVILLEKENILGGYTRQANAMMACGSPLQQRQNATVTGDDVFRIFMDWNHWHRIEPRVVRAFIDKSGDTIRWLEEKGVEFDLITNDYGLAVIHMPKDMMASVQKALIKSLRELDITVVLQTSGRKIVRGDKGQVIGVVAEKRDGEILEIRTASAVIATGGFGDNAELLRKYCPDYYPGMSLDDWPHHKAHSGDGLIMAAEAGAAIADWIPIYHRGGGASLGGPPWRPVLPFAMYQRMIWVNKKGRRFADECSCGAMEGNRSGGNALFLQPGKSSYSVFATDLVEAVENGALGPDTGPQKHAKSGGGAVMVSADYSGLSEKLEKLAGEGKLKMAGSWPEIAEWIGCDPAVLTAEIDKYNSGCTEGRDGLFAKDPGYLVPLRKPPYFAISGNDSAVGETLGGIKVDERMAILDTEYNVIPGLFAAGVIADGHQGQTYCYQISGCAVGFAVVSGHIAGEHAGGYRLKES